MSDTVVLDGSHWNPTANPPNWQKAIDAGIVGVFLKCTEGVSYTDDTFRTRYDTAIAAGLAVSSYHFLRPGAVTDQMEFYLDTLQPRAGERVVIDYEDDDLDIGDLHEAVEALIQCDPSLQITVYSGHLIKEQIGGGYDKLLAENTSLWIAQYTSAASPSWPSGTWPAWSLWQYSDTATVGGYGPVDANRFNGSAENCRKWIGPAADWDEPDKEEPQWRGHRTATMTIESDKPLSITIVAGKNVTLDR